jgi:hypothetical protein
MHGPGSVVVGGVVVVVVVVVVGPRVLAGMVVGWMARPF